MATSSRGLLIGVLSRACVPCYLICIKYRSLVSSFLLTSIQPQKITDHPEHKRRCQEIPIFTLHCHLLRRDISHRAYPFLLTFKIAYLYQCDVISLLNHFSSGLLPPTRQLTEHLTFHCWRSLKTGNTCGPQCLFAWWRPETQLGLCTKAAQRLLGV